MQIHVKDAGHFQFDPHGKCFGIKKKQTMFLCDVMVIISAT